MRVFTFLVAVSICLVLYAQTQSDEVKVMSDDVLFFADFEQSGSELPKGWWVEGGEKVWVEDGRLRVKADPPKKNAPGYVCTVWNDTPISGNVQVDFDAHVVSSTINSNNINFFLFYTHPSGESIYDTRDERENGAYSHYHDLNGYIFTFLNDTNPKREKDGARIRMRRCPGFNLLTETFESHCDEGITYHVTITRKDGHITFAVDGHVYLEFSDAEPWREGLFGLRTYHTDLWWDNIRITRLSE